MKYNEYDNEGKVREEREQRGREREVNNQIIKRKHIFSQEGRTVIVVRMEVIVFMY